VNPCVIDAGKYEGKDSHQGGQTELE